MRAGTLRHRVRIEEAAQTADGQGGFGDAWAAPSGFPASVAANIRPLSTREMLRQGQAQASATHAVRLRYREGITVRMRLAVLAPDRDAGRTLEIQHVGDPSGRGRELELVCREVLS